MALKLGEESELKIALEEDGTIILDWETLVEFPLASLVILMPNEEYSTQTCQSNVVTSDHSKQSNKLSTEDIMRRMDDIKRRRLQNASSVESSKQPVRMST